MGVGDVLDTRTAVVRCAGCSQHLHTREGGGSESRSTLSFTSSNNGKSLLARSAAHESWAQTSDRAARTAPARRAFLDRFERQVDPDGVLSPAQRAQRAESARKAYFAGLAHKSVQARRRAVTDGTES